VFAQELYSLFLNQMLELYLNTMENIIFEFNILYIVYCQTKEIKKINIHKKKSLKKIQQRISKRHLSIARDKLG
jgi:hypothetical protein